MTSEVGLKEMKNNKKKKKHARIWKFLGKYIMYLKLSKPTLHGLTSASSNHGTPQPRHYNLNSGHALIVHRKKKWAQKLPLYSTTLLKMKEML
jgi:hypothetical protein